MKHFCFVFSFAFLNEEIHSIQTDTSYRRSYYESNRQMNKSRNGVARKSTEHFRYRPRPQKTLLTVGENKTNQTKKLVYYENTISDLSCQIVGSLFIF